jgi:hypothetical protein
MWYKLSQIAQQNDSQQLINNFTDRNHANEQIRTLQNLLESLDYASKIAQQTQGGAIKIAQEVLDHKKISSFPDCISALKVAIKVGKDSPAKFSKYCDMAADIIYSKINKLIAMRDKFAFEVKNENKVKKGLF